MRADDLHGALERQVAVGARGNDGAQEALFRHRMQRVVQRHRAAVEFHIRFRAVDVPAREHLGQPLHVGVGIGFHGRAVDHSDRAVGLQLQQADAEQLHDFAGIVFVGMAACLWVFLAVAAIGQHAAHRQVLAHRRQQFLVPAQGVLGQQVHEPRRAEQRPGRRDGGHAHHEDLGQRKRHPRAHLVRGGDELAPQRGFQRRVDAVALERLGVLSLLQQPVEMGLRRGKRQLRVQPGGVAVAHHGVDVGRCGAEGRLRQEARGLARGGAGESGGGGLRRSR
ncbi:hypothetical protein D9M69_519610 [compost metagenome]